MNPQVRIHIIETSKEIIRDRGEKVTAENIKVEFDKLVEGLDVPRIETTEYELKRIKKTEVD